MEYGVLVSAFYIELAIIFGVSKFRDNCEFGDIRIFRQEQLKCYTYGPSETKIPQNLDQN